MKLYVDTSGKQVSVTKDPTEKNDGTSGRQKQERGTGRLMWSTQVFVLDDDGGEVPAGAPPETPCSPTPPPTRPANAARPDATSSPTNTTVSALAARLHDLSGHL